MYMIISICNILTVIHVDVSLIIDHKNEHLSSFS